MRRREECAAATVDASREQAEAAARTRLGVDPFARWFLEELDRAATAAGTRSRT